MSLEIPEVVINRLPVYARALTELSVRGETVVSSQALGELLDVTPAQIRKDLSYFGRFGKQGRGYNVNSLLTKLREILGIDRQWRLILVGVGRLGQAIAEYGGFGPQGFEIVAAFDANDGVVGREIGGVQRQADRPARAVPGHHTSRHRHCRRPGGRRAVSSRQAGSGGNPGHPQLRTNHGARTQRHLDPPHRPGVGDAEHDLLHQAGRTGREVGREPESLRLCRFRTAAGRRRP